MTRTLCLKASSLVGEDVTLKGWVRNRRDHGKLIFVDLNDYTGILQLVLHESNSEAFATAADLRSESVVEVVGTVKERPHNTVNDNIPTGKVEISVSSIKIISQPEVLPFDMGGVELNLELPTLLDYRSLTLRHPKVRSIFKIQSEIVNAFRKIVEELGCTEVFVPTIVAGATEGGTEVFDVNYYGHRAYLSQSPQLYKQMLVPVFERVYTISRAYRAEPSVTTRHLSESTQMDCEFGFVDYDELLTLLEKVGTSIIKIVEESSIFELGKFNYTKIGMGKIPRLTLREAQEIIFKETGRDVRKEPDLGPGDEMDICKWAKDKHDSDFVTITHFPLSKKPFYTMPDPSNPEYSLSYDLLFRGTEVLSGSQRINDYNQLVLAMRDRGVDPEKFTMYLQAFKFGMPPEGGFSFGLERLTWKLLGLGNIREASLYPRDMERVDERFSVIEKQEPKS